MTRMSREMSLVLLGSGLLTAGYFAYPEPDLQAKAERQAAEQVGGHSGTHRHGGYVVFLHGFTTHTSSSVGGGARSAAMPSVSRGGFGSFGGRVSGGG